MKLFKILLFIASLSLFSCNEESSRISKNPGPLPQKVFTVFILTTAFLTIRKLNLGPIKWKNI